MLLTDYMATGRACLRGAVRGAPRLAPVVSRFSLRGVAPCSAPPLRSNRSTTYALGEPTRTAPLVLTAPLRALVGSVARYARECSLGARWVLVGSMRSLRSRVRPPACWLRLALSRPFVMATARLRWVWLRGSVVRAFLPLPRPCA